MDIQRIVLIGALAVISYLLVLQWNQDYGQNNVAVATTSVSSHSAAPELSRSDATPAVADIPSAGPAVETMTPATSTNPVSGLISVTTDTLALLIDPYGGDIIQATLPKHLALLRSDQNFVLLEQSDQRTYVAQSGLTGKDGPDNSANRPRYQSASSSYNLAADADALSVDLVLTQESGVVITKRFQFTRGNYLIKVSYLVNNGSEQPWQGNLFGQLKRDRSADPSTQTSMGMSSYLGPAFSTTSSNYTKVNFDDIDKAKFAEKSVGGWAAMLQHYFVSAWVPEPEQSHNYFARQSGNNYLAGFVSPSLDIAPGQQGQTSANLYIGPKVQERLAQVAPNLELTVDFGWLWWIAQPIFWLLKMFHNLVGNWGFAIILVTVTVKALFFPLSAKAYQSMAKMRSVAPELTRLKELYGDDRQKMSQSMMQLYQKEKINPLGGCLPMLVQMPVFIALYWVLMESVELRHAPFILWIHDLSVMDPYFVLPILMGATMFVQQTLNPTPPDPMQAKIMKLLPFVFTFFFLWFPAGLVVYWVINNVLSIAQQWVITRRIEAEVSAKKA